MNYISAAFPVCALYSVILTFLYFRSPGLNPLCQRDFVQAGAAGSCLCGEGQFCLCTPSIAVDAIIEMCDSNDKVLRVAFVMRRDGRGLAIVGGFLKVGESAEAGIRREVLEETGLTLRSLRQWCLFSSPERDSRRHTASLVFVAQVAADEAMAAGDDAKDIRQVPIEELLAHPQKFAFDHGVIVEAYVQRFLRADSHSKRRIPRVDGDVMLHSQVYAACPNAIK